MSKSHVIYRLACDHFIAGLENMPKGEHECLQCNTIQAIVDVHEYEWHVICYTKDCNYSRWAGLSDINAKDLARRHYLRTNHNVFWEFKRNPAAMRVKEIVGANKLGSHNQDPLF